VDVTALTQPSPVVAALAYQAQTEYEQDPFDATKLRRTTMQVRRVLVVHQDGLMEVQRTHRRGAIHRACSKESATWPRSKCRNDEHIPCCSSRCRAAGVAGVH